MDCFRDGWQEILLPLLCPPSDLWIQNHTGELPSPPPTPSILPAHWVLSSKPSCSEQPGIPGGPPFSPPPLCPPSLDLWLLNNVDCRSRARQPEGAHQACHTKTLTLTPSRYLLLEEHPGTKPIQMTEDPWMNKTSKCQGNRTPSEHSYPTTASPAYPNTTETRENDFKSNFIKRTLKSKWINLLKEIQENITKKGEVFKEETNKSLKNIQGITINR